METSQDLNEGKHMPLPHSLIRRVMIMAGAVALGLPPADSLQAQILKDIEIIEAARDGDVAEARGALLKGESVNSRSRSGTPVVITAIEHGNIAVLRFLLEQGANPDMLEKRSNRSALLIASEVGNTAVVRLLLDAKADTSQADRQGETALMKAARAGAVDAVRLLIGAGADVNATDYAGHSALWHALDGRQKRIAELIQQAGGS